MLNIAGTECVLYQGWVTTSYNGSYSDIVNLYCYTAYHYGFDLAPAATFTAASYYSFTPPENAVQGFYCDHIKYCFNSFVQTNPWWMADLDSPKGVSKIVVKTRKDLRDFSNVEIRLGNTSSFTSNPLFASYMGLTPTPLEILVFAPSSPMTGRYLSLQSITSSGALNVCNIQIIAA
ncbi:uncharacterized protein [Procambarus clarkii]|uniref:uncharacterized protein n=1 Tax=Procambarus clarkii TaxID=6728 RepID=UPI001E678429|nr:uncharacterized protein LOC123765608 [Procambarus clarkii]